MRCILITYFKYLHFNYLTIPQINMQNNGSSSLAKYTKLCMVWQLNIRNRPMLWDFGFAHGPHWGTVVRRPHVPLPPNPGYATAYVHLSHWRNFTLKSGGDQWRRQDLVSWGTTIEAPKAPSWWGMGRGVSSTADYRRSWGASWASPARSGAEPRLLSHFLHILGHTQNASGGKKNTILLLIAQSIRKNWYFYMKTCIQLVLRVTCSLGI